MTPKERQVMIQVVSLLGIAFVLVAGILYLPPGFRERARIQELRVHLADEALEETQVRQRLQSVQEEAGKITARARDIRNRLAQSSFEPLRETGISGFVEELQGALAAPGLTVLQVAYRRREIEKGLLIFPFEGHLEATYSGFRTFLHWVESHPSGLRVDELEFVSLNNDKRLVQFKIRCSARFKVGA